VGEVIALGQITDEIINGWAERYDQRDGGLYCKECGSQIMQTTCYVSIHLKAFEPSCAGPGEVKRINYPFCPKCDGQIEYAQACYHVGFIFGIGRPCKYCDREVTEYDKRAVLPTPPSIGPEFPLVAHLDCYLKAMLEFIGVNSQLDLEKLKRDLSYWAGRP